MTPRPAVYCTEEPCPSCAEPLTVADDGTELVRVECRACGHAEHWLFAGPWTRGDRW